MPLALLNPAIAFVRSLPRRIFACDRILLGSLAIGVVMGAQGIMWGGYDCLNLDRMAFLSLTSKSRGYLEPPTFDKPPLYPYLIYFGVVVPGDAIAKKIGRLGLSKEATESFRVHGELIAARSLQIAMFAACIVFIFVYAREFFGLAAARASALLFATAAGFVPYQVFLTTDLPVVFWMMAALLACAGIVRTPTMGLSILAGVCTGFAAATKYNGLAIGLGIPVAHLLASRPFWTVVKRPAAYVGPLVVPLAFVISNPYCVIKSQKFVADFMYNYVVTPSYAGQSGRGYGQFIGAFAEIFGQPLCWLLTPLILLGLWGAFKDRNRKMWNGFALAAACFLLYAWKIGSFPRIETRFVLPAAPLVLLMAAPGFAWLHKRSVVLVPLFVIPLVCYGLACSWYTARRFPNDPRMAALAWAEKNFPKGAKVETTGSCPNWKKMPERKIQMTRMPFNLGQVELFDKIFANNEWVKTRVDQDREKRDPAWFTSDALKGRNPDFVAVNSVDQESATIPFYNQLLAEQLGYRIVFDGKTEDLPRWVFPRRTEFIANRITLLERNPATPNN